MNSRCFSHVKEWKIQCFCFLLNKIIVTCSHLSLLASSMKGRFSLSLSSFHSAPSLFDISELCILGFSCAIFRLCPLDHTIKAFMGLFTCSFCRALEDISSRQNPDPDFSILSRNLDILFLNYFAVCCVCHSSNSQSSSGTWYYFQAPTLDPQIVESSISDPAIFLAITKIAV